MADGDSAIVADLGANLVCVLLILIAVAGAQSRATPDPAAPVPTYVAAPLSGHAQSDLLFLRLRPTPDVLTLEVTAEGIFISDANRIQPLQRLPDPPPRGVVAYVFSPGPLAALRRLTDEAGVPVQDITIPDALRRATGAPGQSAFSPAFLSLPVGVDPASIRPPLLRLLTNSGAAGALDGTGGGSGIAPLWLFLRQAGNLALMLAALVVLRMAHRRVRS